MWLGAAGGRSAISKQAPVPLIAECALLCRSRIPEPTLIIQRWFLSGCYPKAVSVPGGGSGPPFWSIARKPSHGFSCASGSRRTFRNFNDLRKGGRTYLTFRKGGQTYLQVLPGMAHSDASFRETARQNRLYLGFGSGDSWGKTWNSV